MTMILTLVTNRHRTIDVEIGQPITALAEGERVVTLERLPRGDGDERALSASDEAWIISHVLPLMLHSPSS